MRIALLVGLLLAKQLGANGHHALVDGRGEQLEPNVVKTVLLELGILILMV